MEFVFNDLVVGANDALTDAHSGSLPPRGTGRRKGHRKSRGGCLQCKERKVKCQETRPCGNCIRRGLECKFITPAPPRRVRKHDNAIQAVAIRAQPLDPSLTKFDMLDMRMFHHYMTIAYPYLPLGTEDRWLHQVPSQAHNYEYLMHALLALGGSHLNLISNYDTRGRCDKHRFLAIKGLNEAMAKDDWSSPATDAMLGTAYALTLQCGFEGDSFGELFTLIRGCLSVSWQIGCNRLPSIFIDWRNPLDHGTYMGNYLLNLPLLDSDMVEDALSSMLKLQSLCKAKYERELVEVMIRTVKTLKTSSSKAYQVFTETYLVIMLLQPDEFAQWCDLQFGISALLQGHLLALQALMIPILCREKTGRISFPTDNRFLSVWFPNVYKECPRHLRQYLKWPAEFCFPLKARMDLMVYPTLLATNDEAQTNMLIHALFGDTFPYRTKRNQMSFGASPPGLVLIEQELNPDNPKDVSELDGRIRTLTASLSSRSWSDYSKPGDSKDSSEALSTVEEITDDAPVYPGLLADKSIDASWSGDANLDVPQA